MGDNVQIKEEVKTTVIATQNPFGDDEDEAEEVYQDLNSLKTELLETKQAPPTFAKTTSALPVETQSNLATPAFVPTKSTPMPVQPQAPVL